MMAALLQDGEKCIDRVQGRRADHAEQRPAMLDERDVDGELAVAAEKLLGPVERIDEPESLLTKAFA